jgi:hypothetical protein
MAASSESDFSFLNQVTFAGGGGGGGGGSSSDGGFWEARSIASIHTLHALFVHSSPQPQS